jgi:hypothetical protein
MPRKDLEARKDYAKTQYLKTRESYIARSKARRLKLRAEKALLPKPKRVLSPCNVCNATRDSVEFPSRGNKCKTCVSVYNKAYRLQNAQRIAASKKSWVDQNQKHKAQQDREYAIKNPEARKASREKWDKANPGRTNAAKTRNKLERQMRVPAWLTEDDKWMIEQAYELAKIRTEMFGFQWHVDHIIPLKGRKVSGLHVPTNLQVIPWKDNLRKGSRLTDA